MRKNENATRLEAMRNKKVSGKSTAPGLDAKKSKSKAPGLDSNKSKAPK